MKQISPSGLAAWHAETHRRQDSRLISDRYFYGTVTAVSGGGPFEVSIQRVGDSVSDGNTYWCDRPAYVPQAGDLVRLVWQDAATAVVDSPVATSIGTQTGTSKVDDQSPSLVGGAVSTITIPQSGAFPKGYSSIRIRYDIRSVSANNVDEIHLQFNGDTGAHYDSHYFGAEGTGAVTPAQFLAATSLLCGNAAGGGSSAHHFNGGTIDVINYTSLLTFIKFASHCVRTDSGAMGQIMFGGEWTAAGTPISNITMYLYTGATRTNFAVGSRIITEVIP